MRSPFRRQGKPEDIGRAVRATVGERFRFSTGTCDDANCRLPPATVLKLNTEHRLRLLGRSLDQK